MGGICALRLRENTGRAQKKKKRGKERMRKGKTKRCDERHRRRQFLEAEGRANE